MENSLKVRKECVEELKNLCRTYLVYQRDYSSIEFVFYTLLSYSNMNDSSIIDMFLREIGDEELKLQNYLCRYSNLRYCLALLLNDYYKVSSNMNIAEFLDTETRIFDFLVNIALYGNPDDVDSMDLIKSLCVAALTA
ncbi:MAG: hypothetical protein KBE59_06040 [Acetoanaerobium sp.]|nr:hypothetical protein [Acetoanaerobium sp.]